MHKIFLHYKLCSTSNGKNDLDTKFVPRLDLANNAQIAEPDT